MEANPGDRVDIRTVHGNQEGILVESSDSSVVLLKLASGYNIGIKKEDIVEISVLQTCQDEKKKELKNKADKNKKNIDIIMTGGTISSRIDYKTGGVSWLTSPEQLLEMYPEIFEICNIRKVKIPFMKASENMDSRDWKEIAKNVAESLNDENVSGVIVTHGTDFLHYTAAALSFFLRDLNKPVVLTYSQRSSDRASSDAAMNLRCAAIAACSDIAEVMLVGHGTMSDDFCYALPGTKVRKLHSSRRDAFKSVNAKPIAKIFPSGNRENLKGFSGPQKSGDFCGIEIISAHKLRDNAGKTKLDDSFNDRIALLKFYPGMDAEMIDWLSVRYHGIVLELAGLGHLATREARKNLLPSIKRAIDNGFIVCAAPQTIYGRLDPLVYSPGRELAKIGVIFLEDMLAETALVKLGWVLGHSAWKNRTREKMLENFAGEISERLEE